MNEVDLDRLADFIGGAFEGAPSGTQVSHLVSTVPEWRHAHDHLVAADRAVSHDLQLLAQTSPPMPGDVAARLHAALAAQAPAVSALAGSHLTGSHLTAPGPGTTGPGRGKAPGGPGSRPSQ
ncbi:MAG: hypothetical protein JXA67_08750, partial [Micromonosporaceae bacterium]|nr:hypothetical protein [Micromonosporaceae bacterium]